MTEERAHIAVVEHCPDPPTTPLPHPSDILLVFFITMSAIIVKTVLHTVGVVVLIWKRKEHTSAEVLV